DEIRTKTSMWTLSSCKPEGEMLAMNIKARRVLRELGVMFDDQAIFNGLPHIHFHDLIDEPEEAGRIKLERFRDRIRFHGSGTKVNSGTLGVYPHDFVRLTIVRWGAGPEQIGSIEIGEGTELNGTAIVSFKRVSIGKNVLIGPGVVIMDSDGHGK